MTGGVNDNVRHSCGNDGQRHFLNFCKKQSDFFRDEKIHLSENDKNKVPLLEPKITILSSQKNKWHQSKNNVVAVADRIGVHAYYHINL